MVARSLACLLALVAPVSFGVACKSSGGEGGDVFLTVIETSPVDGANEVPVASRIGFRVDAPIDATTLNANTFFVSDDEGNVFTGEYEIGGNDGTEPEVAVMRLSEPLSVITSYTATITTGLVAGGASLEEDYTWRFRTLDSEWGVSEWLGAIDIGVSSRARAAVDPALNLLAVWEYEDSVGTGIWANNYTRSDLWGTPERIDDGQSLGTVAEVALDADGNGYAVWQRSTDGGLTSNIWANRYDAVDGWGNAERLQDADAGPGRVPRVVAGPVGTALAVFLQRDTATDLESLWASEYVAGQGWSFGESVGGEPVPIAGTATWLGMDAAGNAFTIYPRAEVPGGNVLWANRYTGGRWGTPVKIEDDPLSLSRAIRLSVGSNGEAFVIWIQEDDGRDDVWAVGFDGTQWGTPERIDDYDDGSKNVPDIAVDGSGVAHAVWSQVEPYPDPELLDEDIANIYAVEYTPGSGWGTPELIEPPREDDMGNLDPDEDGDATVPRVGTNSAGNTFVVWRQTFDDWGSVWSNRRDPGEPWAGVELIENLPRTAKFPFVVVDEDRHAHAVWLHSLDTGIDWVRTNRFE